MSLSITINGVNRTQDIDRSSFKIRQVLTRRQSSCSFNITQHAGRTYVPTIGHEIIVLDGATRIFGGVIVSLESQPNAYGVIEHQIDCQDYSRILGRKLVPDVYQNMTVDAIIADLKTNYFPSGFTITQVDCTTTINYISFNYKPLDKCIQELSELVGYDWYVDYNKDVYFKSPTSSSASFDVQDDDGSYVYNSLVIRKDNSQVRNRIVVRGGLYLGDTFTAELEANGVDFVFPLPYKFDEFRATLTGDPLSVGIDYINDPNSYDALYNFQEKILRFKQADTPTAGSVLVVSGRPNLPVIVKLASPAAIDTMSATEGGDGVYEHLIVDKSINSKEGARQRARQEILAYASTLSEGSFITWNSGLVVGQRIRINSTSRSVDEYFIVNQVETVEVNKDQLEYRVSLITTKTADLIDVLKKLLLQETKNIEIDPDEVVDQVFNFDDTGTFTDDLGTFSTHGPTYTWGSSSNQGNWDFATWSWVL